MKMNLVAPLVSLCFSTAALAGGMTSTGGDSHKWGNESAWFLSNSPVSYCIEIAPTEKVSAGKVKADFESAVSTWKKYYEERASRIHPPEFKLNFNFQLESCQPSTRLKIFVGVMNADVDKAKKLFEDPYAFAYRSEYDFEAGLGRGFIWFKPSPALETQFPQWNTPYALHGMLLHELGHVYGCGHMKNTIMEENPVSNMQAAGSNDPNWAKYGAMYMTHIDHHQFLLLSPNMRVELKGVLALNSVDEKNRFERFMGRAPRGPVRAQFERFQDRVDLTISDDAGSTKFAFPLNYENRTSFDLGTQVFYSVRGNEGWATGTSGETFLTSVKTAKGEKLLAQVEFNPNELGWPVRVRYMDKGKMTDVFQSDLWITTGLPR